MDSEVITKRTAIAFLHHHEKLISIELDSYDVHAWWLEEGDRFSTTAQNEEQ